MPSSISSSNAISPFQNESEVITIGDLVIENRLDRVQISGSIDITRDKVGYESILALKRQIDAIAAHLKCEDLPDKVEILEVKMVKNPF